MGKIEDSIRGMIRAYHGSPLPEHFDKFDAKFLGSGQGAESFAHGHYLAQNPDVAADYRRSLSHSKLREDFLSNLDQEAEPEEVIAALPAFDHRQQKFMRAMDDNAWLGFDYPSQGISQALRRSGLSGYDATDELVDATKKLGTGYEVEIAIPEGDLLDWDAPLVSQQSKLQRVWDSIREQWSREASAATRRGERSPVPVNAEEFLQDMQKNPAYTGKALWHTAVTAHAGETTLAADLLHSAGIPGVRYLDSGSRAAGDGTRNYVIFPGAEDSIRILRKYGLLAPMAVGAASQGQE